jgi:hypothetical protein
MKAPNSTGQILSMPSIRAYSTAKQMIASRIESRSSGTASTLWPRPFRRHKDVGRRHRDFIKTVAAHDRPSCRQNALVASIRLVVNIPTVRVFSGRKLRPGDVVETAGQQVRIA